MAALLNRDRVEASFARRLEKLNSRHRRELRELMGSPPRLENVPESWWRKVEEEVEQTTLLMLILIFVAASEQHGGPKDLAAARTFAASRASTIARTHRREIERRMKRQTEAWNRRIASKSAQFARRRDRALRRVEDAKNKLRVERAKARTDRVEGTVARAEQVLRDADDKLAKLDKQQAEPIRPSEVRSATIDAIGVDRAVRVATTGTTQAASAGSEFAIQQTVGFSEADTWFTENDERVCPICLPLHGTFRRVWSQRFPDGPPAHSPGSSPIDAPCRCWISYENEKLSRDEKSRFKRILKQAKERGDTTPRFRGSPGDPF